jgi:hypothetical protein
VLQSQNLDECNAPAPEDFHITSIGGNFIALAWIPVWVGGDHTLTILENDSVGGWIPFDTIYNVPGASYTVEGLESGKEYRFILATNCSTGAPSTLNTIIDGITLIVDLAIIGRIPVKILPVDCNNIPLNNNWVGFKVEYINGGISVANYFEFVIVGASANNKFFSHVEIRRVYRDLPIVAVDPDAQWPTCDVPIRFDVGTSFRMARLIGGGPNKELIGWIKIYQNSASSISICADYNHPTLPWKNAYTFTALIAPKAGVSPGCGDRSDNLTTANNEIRAQSPFDEILTLFFPQSFSGDVKVNIRLLNTNGQSVMEQVVEGVTSQVAFPVRTLVPGVYILQIKTKEETHSLKVLKV